MRISLLCNDRVALPAADWLISSGVIVCVGMPNRASDTQTITRQKCLQRNIPFRVFNKKQINTELPAWLKEYAPDAVFVKTFPFLIPPSALSIPKFGFINFHYAPLPEWRGSNPLFWMIRNRSAIGGVTVHEMNEHYDAGPILLERSFPLLPNINFGMFYSQLALMGLQLTAELIYKMESGAIEKKEQNHAKAKWYGHPKAEDLFINWQTMEAEEIAALVKACNPWNKGAATQWKGWTFGISYASIIQYEMTETFHPGTIVSTDAGNGFIIASKNKKAIMAEVVYCEEGFYPGYCISAFGLQKNDLLS